MDILIGVLTIFLLIFPLLAMFIAVVLTSRLTKRLIGVSQENVNTNLGAKYFDC